MCQVKVNRLSVEDVISAYISTAKDVEKECDFSKDLACLEIIGGPQTTIVVNFLPKYQAKK